MAIWTRVVFGQRSDGHIFLCKFLYFQMAISCLLLGLFTPNLGILWSLICALWLYGSIVTNPIIYRLAPSPSRFEIRQWLGIWPLLQLCVDLTTLDIRWTLRFFPGTDFIYNYLHIAQKWIKTQRGKLKNSIFLSTRHRILPYCNCKVRETVVAKFELVL